MKQKAAPSVICECFEYIRGSDWRMSLARSSVTGWSPERQLWSALEFLCRDLAWKRVDLDRNRSHLVSERDRGVYLIAAPPPMRVIDVVSSYTILYAGQVRSRNLRSRFLEHIKNPNPKLRLFMDCFYPTIHFWFAVTDDQSRIDALESLLIQTFNPPCNSISAPSTQILLARLGHGKKINRST